MARQDDMPRRNDPTEIEPRPQPPPAPERGPDGGGGGTAAQLRRDIDSGATGDKVAVLDPAASPLGTDAEAGAGPAPQPGAVATARREERAAGRRAAPEHPHDRPAGRHGGMDATALTLLVAILAAALLAAVALWLSFG